MEFSFLKMFNAFLFPMVSVITLWSLFNVFKHICSRNFMKIIEILFDHVYYLKATFVWGKINEIISMYQIKVHCKII